MHLLCPNYDPSRPSVLCLNSDQFNRDITMLQHRGTHFNWVAVLDAEMIEAQVKWMPKRLQAQSTYVNESGPDVDVAWQKAKAYGHGVIVAAKQQIHNLVAVMAGNWDYWNEECIRLACNELGLPFLVLMREHNLTEARWQVEGDFFNTCKYIPKVAGVAVAGHSSVELFSELNLHPRSKLRATGFPRLDVWHSPVEAEYSRPIVLLSYRKGYGADEQFPEMLRIFADAALRHPAVPFLVKAKHKPEIPMIEHTLSKLKLELKVVDSLNLASLLKGARAIVGYHSLAVYEALLSGARVMVPQWGPANIDPRLQAPSPTDPRLAGHMEFYNDAAAFARALDHAATSKSPPAGLAVRAAVFNEYMCFSLHETASARVEQFVADFTASSAAVPAAAAAHRAD